ncbi:MAG: 4Fe-4S binding protein [Desulfurobacteriaceae bacterium]
MAHYIVSDLCIGCGACAEVCPTNCIFPTDDGKYDIDENECIDCGACVEVCPADAISAGTG